MAIGHFKALFRSMERNLDIACELDYPGKAHLLGEIAHQMDEMATYFSGLANKARRSIQATEKEEF